MPTTLALTINQFQTTLVNDETTWGIFIDLAKALYTVNPSMLLKNLSYMYIVRGNAFKLIKSYPVMTLQKGEPSARKVRGPLFSALKKVAEAIFNV